MISTQVCLHVDQAMHIIRMLIEQYTWHTLKDALVQIELNFTIKFIKL